MRKEGYFLFEILKGRLFPKRASKKREKEKIREFEKLRAYRKFNVSGVTYNGRQQLLHAVVRKRGRKGIGDISFAPDTDNKHDPNAIKIVFEEIGVIGYVPEERTLDIKKIIDKNKFEVKWDIDYFDKSENKEIIYMEIRMYLQNKEG